MTAAGVIAPVIPPPSANRATTHAGAVPLARERLPLPDLPPQRTSAVVYGAPAVGDRGRVADRVVLRAGLGRRAPLRFREAGGTLTVVPDPAGDHQVTGQGHVRIPAALRHRWGLATGDRVVLAGDPGRSHLAIYSPTALDKVWVPRTVSPSSDQRVPGRPTSTSPSRRAAQHDRSLWPSDSPT